MPFCNLPDTSSSIEAEQLLGWAVIPGGDQLQLSLRVADGTIHGITLPFDALSSLMMTLPRMLQAALDARTADQSLRVVQPLTSWRIEQLEETPDYLLKLGTKSGFEVSFALDCQLAESLGSALQAAPRKAAAAPIVKPH
jgi:hypothetical protein